MPTKYSTCGPKSVRPPSQETLRLVGTRAVRTDAPCFCHHATNNQTLPLLARARERLPVPCRRLLRLGWVVGRLSCVWVGGDPPIHRMRIKGGIRILYGMYGSCAISLIRATLFQVRRHHTSCIIIRRERRHYK